MARPKSDVPRYRKHRSGQARVTINGRDYYLGPHGSKASKREYDRLVAEYLASGRSPTFGATPDQRTMATIMAAYLRHAKQYYGTGKSSEWHRIKHAVKPVKKLYAGLPASEFGPTELKAVRQTMVEAGWARTTINAHVKRIVRMFKWAAVEELVPASVHATLRLLPGLKLGRTEAKETAPVKPVPQDVVDATIEHLPTIVADMVRVQLLIGCRPSEVCKLTPGMIDRTGDVWTAKLDKHKTAHHGRERVLYIGPLAQQILTPYLLRGPDDRLFRPCDTVRQTRSKRASNRTTPKSCGNRPGKRSGGLKGKRGKRQPRDHYDTSGYARAISRAAKKANVEHWAPNQLRHSRGTVVRAKFGLDAAASILGHAKVGVTQVYAEQDRNRALEVARKIG